MNACFAAMQGHTTLARTKLPSSEQKLHQVLLPKVTKPARSTKPLTLPDDFELQTSKRCDGRPGAAAPQQLVRSYCWSLHAVVGSSILNAACMEQSRAVSDSCSV